MHDSVLSQSKAQTGKFISKSGVGIIFVFKALCITSGTRNFVLFLAVSCLRKWLHSVNCAAKQRFNYMSWLAFALLSVVCSMFKGNGLLGCNTFWECVVYLLLLLLLVVIVIASFLVSYFFRRVPWSNKNKTLIFLKMFYLVWRGFLTRDKAVCPAGHAAAPGPAHGRRPRPPRALALVGGALTCPRDRRHG